MKLFFFVKFILLFLCEFLKANLSVAYAVLFVRRSLLRPCIVEYDVRDLSSFEQLVLAQLITLTPGTIVTNIDQQRKVLFVHILNTEDPQAVLDGVSKKLKRALLKVTR